MSNPFPQRYNFIEVKMWHTGEKGETLCNTVSFNRDECQEFQELVQRGTNLWPDASADMKEFADIVTNGKPLQKYHEHASTQMDTSNSPAASPHNLEKTDAGN